MVRVVIDRFAARKLTTRLGLRFIHKVLDEIVDEARVRALVGPYSKGGLSRRIRKHVVVFGSQINGRVGADLPYAASTNMGARKHVILPHGNYPLRFFWRKVGHTVRFASVNHPGQKGTGWLKIPLERVARKHGMRVL